MQNICKTKREIIFISHATPNDNEFVIWLASRLNNMGYKIWVDVEKLKGGETFWDDIQKVIKEEAIKVIVVLSKDSVTKQGVLNEISHSLNVEREYGLQNFILPIKISSDLKLVIFLLNFREKITKIIQLTGEKVYMKPLNFLKSIMFLKLKK